MHRDIKPANIFLCPQAQAAGHLVRVLDFGIAKAIAGDESKATKLTQTGQLLGTPFYMAPEQVSGKAITPMTDLYAFGLVMAEMLTGQPLAAGTTPFEVLMTHVSQRPFVLHDEVRASPLGPVIYRAIKKEPEDRWPSAMDMRDAVRAAFAEMKTAFQTEVATPPVAQTVDQGPVVAAPAGAVVAAPAPTMDAGPSTAVSATPLAPAAPDAGAAPASDGYAPAPGLVDEASYGGPAGHGGPGYHVPYAPPPQPSARAANPAVWMLVGGLIVLVVLGGIGAVALLSRQGDRPEETAIRPPTPSVETTPTRPPDVQKPPREPKRLERVEDQAPVTAPAGYRAGQKVMVWWGSKWWPGTIIKPVGKRRYLIHYDGWSSSWDEVVGPGRLKPR